jgi:hypothetical protein
MRTEADDAVQHVQAAERRLAEMNALLAEWAACAVEESAPLIERLEDLGYAVRGKSREAVAEVLRHPPTRPARGAGAAP